MDEIEKLAKLLIEQKKTICSCESFTAGLFAASLGSVPGISAVLKGGLVTYFNSMKETLAHVPSELIERYGVVSSECAVAMAKNTRQIMDCDYCVSFTGNAGPGAMEDKPAGSVYVCIDGKDRTDVFFWTIPLERNKLREKAVSNAAAELCRRIEQAGLRV